MQHLKRVIKHIHQQSIFCAENSECCLSGLLDSWYRYNRCGLFEDKIWLVLQNSWKQLAIRNCFGDDGPFLFELIGISEDLLRECIEKYPGPISSITDKYQVSLLGKLVSRNKYSLDLLRWVYDQYREVLKIQEMHEYRQTVLFRACAKGNLKVIRFLMQECPEAAWIPARYSEYPSQQFCNNWEVYLVNDAKLKWEHFLPLFETLVRAFSVAAFTMTTHHNEFRKWSPLTTMLQSLESQSDLTKEKEAQAMLFLLFNVYRYGDKINSENARNVPSYPGHICTS